MSTTTLDPAGAGALSAQGYGRRDSDGGIAARRAVMRWSWRLFRREWRQQLLVLALITLAVATTILGAAVASNNPPSANFGFGTAGYMASFQTAGPRTNTAIAALEHRFGTVEVIENETLQVPGSINTYDLRAQESAGPFSQPMLQLLSGHYPTTAGEVALTSGLASQLGLAVGDTFHGGGVPRQVVGIVQNPQSLLDEFALVIPGQVTNPSGVTALFDAPGIPPASIGPNVSTPATVASSNPLNPETISLVAVTLGMLLIALVAIGGFTVLAQRRLRSLGMLAATGATTKHVRLVVLSNGVLVGITGAILGTALGIAAWLAYRPHLEQTSHHLIGTWSLPWSVVALAVVLSIAATFFAASRPARSVARIPIVAALSGRPAPPRKVHRSAIPGIVLLVLAFLLLGYSGGTNKGVGSGGSLELVLGLVLLVPAVILLAPFFLVLLARVGSRAPLSIRLALRDLSRYRARSGSALAAISIGVMIATLVAVLAYTRYSNVLDPAGPNVAPNQMLISNNNPSAPTAAQAKAVQTMAAGLGAEHVFGLDMSGANLDYHGSGRGWDGSVYVATPQLLQAFGITPSEINPNADIVTSLPGLSGVSHLSLDWCSATKQVSAPQTPPPGGGGTFSDGTVCTGGGSIRNPVIQELGPLPSGVHAPNTLVTERFLREHGLMNTLSNNGWMIITPQALTAPQIHSAQLAAAAANLAIETKNDEPTSGEVVNTATAFGILLALAILAMSLGLIRSEAAGDLRTLTATGASSFTRRMLTAATAGGLAFLGGLLGTLAAYVGMIGWIRNNSLNGGISALANVPVNNLLVVLIGMPIAAAVLGWLLAGREPSVIAHQPIE
jgi:putative ABC transport system permease protein